MGRNMLFITGTNVERTSIKNYKQTISRDPDIKKLMRRGLFTLKHLPYISFFLSLLFLIISVSVNVIIPLILKADPASSITSWISALIPFDVKLVSPSFMIFFLILSFVIIVVETRDYVITFSDHHNSLKKAVTLIFRSKAPKNPLELWDILQASIMDAQLTTSAERLFNTDVALMYGGTPYYDTLLVDSIYLKWDVPEKITIFEMRKHFNRLFTTHSKRTILGEIEQNYFPTVERLQVSNCVFGILFLSEYIQSFIQKFYPDATKKFRIDYEQTGNPSVFWDTIDSNQSTHLHSLAARALMGYSTNPSFFTFSERDDLSGTITIDHIDFISKKNLPDPDTLRQKITNLKKNNQINKYCKKNKIIRIPVKKLIALPFGQTDFNDPLPKSLVDLDKRVEKFFGALVLGGAEQNIILSTLINIYKWRKDSGIDNNPDCRYYGFAENVIDAKGLLETEQHHAIAPKNIEYLIGTEGFVYGVPTRTAVGKIVNIDDCRQAEVFKLVINKFPYYFIYGYHAVATKIATLKFFVSLTNDDSAFVPAKDPDRVTYNLYYPHDTSFKGLCDHWDKGDPINSDSSTLLNKLASIKVR